MPMPINASDTTWTRWLNKPVQKTRLLDDMEEPQNWSHHGQGLLSFTTDRAKSGPRSLRLQSPTKTGQPNRDAPGRPFGEAVARRQFGEEDWSEFNRISFWVYPHLPGFLTISMLVKLNNAGQTKVPDSFGREGLNYFLLQPDQWNQVVWEIPHLARDKVSALDFVYRLQGHEPEATNFVTFDLDHLELQQVDPDPFEGWQLGPGRLAYSHSGYQVGSRKVALAGTLPVKEFQLLQLPPQAAPPAIGSAPGMPASLPGAKAILSKEIHPVQTPFGQFQLLDFTEVRQPGVYVIQAGDLLSRPFPIDDQAWLSSIWKIVNFFYCERCGIEIPGIHRVCHRDWQARQGAQTLVINGGWHDAGDLSQGLVNTAEAVQAMFQLAHRLKPSQPILAARLVDEATWGLAWLHKTRFDDGQRVLWATMDYWTDGEPGTADDTFGQVGNDPFAIYLAAAAQAVAARFLRETNPELAAASLALARADWTFADNQAKPPSLELAAAGARASLELFKLTGEQVYASRACQLANVISRCQQRTWPDWKIPLTGFFYTTPDRQRLLHYAHRGHEQMPIVALADLCQTFPQHQQWMDWYATVLLYSEYLRALSRYTAPYHMLPASIYDLNESDQPGFREQVLQGIPLDSQHYLRRFPVWFAFRGNYGTLLSQTKALSAAAQLRLEHSLFRLAEEQLQWVVGRNPFTQSTLFGEGHNYAPQYTALSGDMVGSFPVGIQTRAYLDQPYWPAANCYNYKEVWVHPASRWLFTMMDLTGPATFIGRDLPESQLPPELVELTTGTRYFLKSDSQASQLQLQVPPGQYTLRQSQAERSVTLLPGQSYAYSPSSLHGFQASAQAKSTNTVQIKLRVDGTGTHRFQLRTYNLHVDQPLITADLNPIKAENMTWEATVPSPDEPWIALVIPDNNFADRQELFSLNPPARPPQP